MKKEAKPFLKWVGGKKQLLPEIKKYYPFNEKINKYSEPFIGGGAVLFDILNTFDLKEIYISDMNKELVNTYLVIQNSVNDLIKELKILESEYIPLDEEKRKEYYLAKRKEFNELKKTDYNYSIKLATLFIFLNKTCFNGLYRVNSKGEFNVPSGVYKKPLICDEENLIVVSEKLRNVKIVCTDYKSCINFVDENTFVYIDPPYRPLNKTSSFTSYNDFDFDDKKQTELAEFSKQLDKTGAKILLSNSNPKNVDANDNFFECLYNGFNIKEVMASRMINSKASGRGKISELLISNFQKGEIFCD